MSNIFARSAALFSAAAVLAVSSSAFALTTPAGMGTEGSLTVSADRLFGVLISSVYEESTQGNVKVENTSRSTDINIINPAASGYAGPRVGIDYTVIPKLTIGAAVGIGFGSSKTTSKAGGTETTNDGPSTTTILFAPRVGYMIDFSDQLGLWPRAGITLLRQSSTTKGQNGDVKNTFQQIGATIDVPLVIAPADHFAFTAGPFVDFPLTSSQKTEAGGTTVEPDNAPKVTNFGLAFGMLGSF